MSLNNEHVTESRIFVILHKLCPTAMCLDGIPSWFLKVGALDGIPEWFLKVGAPFFVDAEAIAGMINLSKSSTVFLSNGRLPQCH